MERHEHDDAASVAPSYTTGASIVTQLPPYQSQYHGHRPGSIAPSYRTTESTPQGNNTQRRGFLRLLRRLRSVRISRTSGPTESQQRALLSNLTPCGNAYDLWSQNLSDALRVFDGPLSASWLVPYHRMYFGNRYCDRQIQIWKQDLIAALENNCIYGLKTYVVNGADINIVVNYNVRDASSAKVETVRGNLLHMAVDLENYEATKLLLGRRAAVNARDEYERTPLHIAATKKGNEALVQLLIDHGADPNRKTRSQATAAHLVKDSSYVRCLVNAKARLNDKDDCGQTPTDRAIAADNEQIVARLRQGGATINPALLKWVLQSSRDREYLLCGSKLLWPAAKAIQEYVGDKGQSILHELIEDGGGPAIVSLALELGAHVNAPDTLSRMPLHLAAIRGNVEVILELVSRGASITATDYNHTTPLQYAVKSRQLVAPLAAVVRPNEICLALSKSMRQRIVMANKCICLLSARKQHVTKVRETAEK